MYLLLLAGFSNYNNRTIRKAATPDDYAYSSTGHWYITEDKAPYGLLSVNFKPNDGVSTTQIINNWLSSEYGHEPDYLIAFDNKDTSTECIVSRWYILEVRQTRGGQKELVLRRDLIADYYEQLKSADIFVEKGLCADNDPLIFNDEGMSLNKIKLSEDLLIDDSKCAWLVGYMDGRYRASINIAHAVNSSSYITTAQAATLTGLTESQIQSIIQGNPIEYFESWGFMFLNKDDASGMYKKNTAVIRFNDDFTGIKGIDNKLSAGVLIKLTNEPTLGDAFRGVFDAFYQNSSATIARFKAITNRSGPIKSSLDKLVNLGKPIIYNSVAYRIQKADFGDARRQASTISTDPALKAIIDSQIQTTQDGNFIIWPSVGEFKATIVVDESTNATLSIGGSSVKSLTNRPYKMFCIPAGDYRVVRSNPTPEEPYPPFDDYSGRYSKMIVSALIAQQGGDVPDPDNPTKLGIYDIQLLPYCPIRSMLNPMGLSNLSMPVLSLEGLVSGTDYDTLESDDPDEGTLGYVFYCTEDSFEAIIPRNIQIDESPKFDSNAKMLRICSPNYQGSFDFNVAKNNGVNGFIASCTYKPFTPFIRVAPFFGGLYGGEFGDQRGLICGGNFSLSQVSSAWRQFELNNKNYQNIFNREIQSLDLQQSIQMRDQIIGAISGTAVGAAQGAQLGGATGSPYGAAIGAVAGAEISGIAGAVDVQTLAQLQKDQRDLKIDKYNYNLGNIKAIPNTLTKIDTFDISSKIFPFLEMYGPTDEERALFLERIRLQSYTIMRIEKLGNQMTEIEDGPADVTDLHFVKGQLIRTENNYLCVDSHQWDELYAELSKGVYI